MKMRTINVTLPKAIVLAGSMFFAVSAPAADGPDPYKMAVIMDRAHGEKILQGDYRMTVERLQRKENRFAAQLNLCVAHTMLENLSAAEARCEQAVQLADDEPGDLAVALSNRGVLRALRGNMVGAEQDFSEALSLKGSLFEPAYNLERLSIDAPTT